MRDSINNDNWSVVVIDAGFDDMKVGNNVGGALKR
jgi:hypothetical protein